METTSYVHIIHCKAQRDRIIYKFNVKTDQYEKAIDFILVTF